MTDSYVIQQETPSSEERSGDLESLISERSYIAVPEGAEEFVDFSKTGYTEVNESESTDPASTRDQPQTNDIAAQPNQGMQAQEPEAFEQAAPDPELARRYAEAEHRTQQLQQALDQRNQQLQQVAQNALRAEEQEVRREILSMDSREAQEARFNQFKLSRLERVEQIRQQQDQQINGVMQQRQESANKLSVAYNFCHQYGIPTEFTPVLMSVDTPQAMDYMARQTKDAYDIRVQQMQQAQQQQQPQQLQPNARTTTNRGFGSSQGPRVAPHSGDLMGLIQSRGYVPSRS